ncbi:MAG: dihydrodipicolinate synthase family protein [Pseudomonadota bacterium]
MSRELNFEGVIAPVLTPFGEDGAPDSERFVEHAMWLLDNGCNALAPFGTTSEANSIGLDERMELLEDLVDAGAEPTAMMPGTGTCAVSDTVMLTQHALDLGCGGVLMLPPFYYKNPSDEGLFRYFAEVIEETADENLSIYLYHIPQVSGIGFSIDLVKRLKSEFPETIIGLKDSSGDWDNMKALLTEVPELEMFPGSELFLLDGLRNGAAGVISASANVTADKLRLLYDDFAVEDADAQQAKISALRKAIQGFPMIPVLKAIVAHYRQDPGWALVRPPFEALPPAEAEKAVVMLAQDHGLKLDVSIAA